MTGLWVILFLTPAVLEDEAIPEIWCRRAEEMTYTEQRNRHLSELRDLEVIQKRDYCNAHWKLENAVKPKR